MAKGPIGDTLVQQLKAWYRADMAINAEWRQRAIESFQFYTGIMQWDEEVISKLFAEGRPALTINHVFPIINMLAGFQRQNRSDIKLYPRNGATGPIAALGTELIKHTLDCCGGDYELSDAFHDGAVCGKGFVSANRIYQYDPIAGDLVISKDSPFTVLPDQANKHYDINKGDHVFQLFWWGKREVELQYPGKAKELREATDAPEWEYDQYYELGEPGIEDDYDDYDQIVTGTEHKIKTKYLGRLAWWKRWEKCEFLIHQPTLSIWMVNEKEQRNRALQEIVGRGWQLADCTTRIRPCPVLHKAITVGDLLLEHTVDPLNGITQFPVFRYCPYWIDGYVMGVIDNIKDPQRELNKRRSQTLHTHNQSANSGWVVDRIKDDYDKFIKKFGSKPGIVLDKSKTGGFLERIEPTRLDEAALTLSEMGAGDMKDISGVNPDLTGSNKEEKESGRARLLRQQAGLTVSEVMYDNFNRTQKQVGEFLWEVIRRSNVYSEEEVKSVVQEQNLKHFVRQDQLTGEQQIDLSAMRTWSLGRYGVKVDRSSSLPTVRMANYEQLVEAIQAGIPIPPEFLIELSDLPNKDEIIQYLRQIAGMQQEQPQQQPARRKQLSAGAKR